MINKDDEEEKGSFGQSKYPCMPSLVALQQMRNRLHLAYLGRKLMKWTAMATARELRRICLEMKDLYMCHGEDVSDCFIMLARCRYYYPNINKMVLNDIPKKAAVSLSSTTKTVSGVRIFQYSVTDTGHINFQHLGIDKGGDLIKETKEKWKNLLIAMVHIVELRSSYILVEAANRSATKRQNVLGKLVIPRTQQSLAYIMLELEEMAREELFRIKKVVEIKKKKRAKILDARKKLEPKPVPEPEPEPEPVRVLEPVPEVEPEPEPEYISEPEPEVIPEPQAVPEPEPEPIPKSEPIPEVIPEPQPIPPIVKPPKVEKPSPKIISPPEFMSKPEMILPSKSKEIAGCCAAAKLEMQRILERYNLEESKEFDASIIKRLAAIKKQIAKLENYSSSIASEEKVPTMEDSIDMSRTTSAAGTSGSMRSKPSTDSRKKAAFQSDTSYYSSVYEDAEAIEYLRKQVEGIERLTSEINSQITSKSFDKFLIACKDFKGKLNEMTPKPSNNVVNKLTAQLDEAIRLSQAAQVCCLDKEKVSQFIEACEEIKRQVNRSDRRDKNISEGLTSKVSDIVSLLSRLKRDGLITESVEQIFRKSAPREGVMLYDDEVVDDVMLDLPSDHENYQLNTPVSRDESVEETINQTVKILRIKNPDGTITEKREIIITTQRRDPSRTSSKNANIHYLFVPDNIYGFKRAMSAGEVPKKKNFILKQCISTAGTAHTGDKVSYFEGCDDLNEK